MVICLDIARSVQLCALTVCTYCVHVNGLGGLLLHLERHVNSLGGLALHVERHLNGLDGLAVHLERHLNGLGGLALHLEPETVLVVTGDMNTHVGKRENSEETVGKYGWGSRNREGQDLVEMLARNQLVVVNSFFQKRESHKITYISGNNRTEIDLLIVNETRLETARFWQGST